MRKIKKTIYFRTLEEMIEAKDKRVNKYLDNKYLNFKLIDYGYSKEGFYYTYMIG